MSFHFQPGLLGTALCPHKPFIPFLDPAFFSHFSCSVGLAPSDAHWFGNLSSQIFSFSLLVFTSVMTGKDLVFSEHSLIFVCQKFY